MSAGAAARFTVLPTPDDVAEATADRFVEVAQGAIAERGIFRVALSGGSTPKRVYPLLAAEPRRSAVDWSRVDFFWGDERAVPPDHPESNFGVAYQMLIAQLPGIDAGRIHRMPAEVADLDAAALAYEAELRLAFGVRGDEPPEFDLIWLGMGPDGHVASLVPGTRALDETRRWVVANWVPQLDAWRLSLTFPVLDAARRTIVVLTGADKADPLRAVRSGGSDLPAARLDGRDVEWIVDRAAVGEADPIG